MRKLLGLIKTAVGVTIFLLLLGFAVKNSDSVAMRYFLGLEWHAPLVLMLLVFFTAGAALGIAASLMIMVRQRREIVGLKREIRSVTRATLRVTCQNEDVDLSGLIIEFRTICSRRTAEGEQSDECYKRSRSDQNERRRYGRAVLD